MELAILAVLAVLAIPVGVIVLFVQLGDVKRRLTLAETALKSALDQLAALANATPAAPSAQTAAQPSPPPPLAEIAPPAPAITAPAITAQTTETAPPAPPPPPVPRAPDLLERFGAWLRENWVYAVSGVSLALAGVFLVQYGAERGLLPPGLRVLAALGFGAALIAGGEVLRRRFGDSERAATAYLPSLLSGAGLVSAFAAILAARQLYGLIGPELGFLGLTAIAAAAILLGWLHGPLLVALGLSGATLAPFLVGGSSDSVDWLYAYFALVAAVGLAVDALRRWAWVSALATALAFAAGLLLHLGGGTASALMLMATALVPLAIAIPARALWPDQSGPGLLTTALLARSGAKPGFPTLLAAAATLAALALLILLPAPDLPLLPFVLIALLGIALSLWSARAPGLHDLPLFAALALLLRLVAEAQTNGAAFRAFTTLPGPEQSPDSGATLLVLLAAALSTAIAWRGLRGGQPPLILSAGAALAAPLAALALSLAWPVTAILGPYPWALHVIALAALMVALALQHARADAPALRRFAHFTLSALALIAFAVFLVLSHAALSLALAALVVIAAALDRRLKLPEMALAVQAGAMLLGWRMAIDPGLDWALNAPLVPVLLAYLGPAAGFAATLWLLRGTNRPAATAFGESGLALALVLLADVLILRGLSPGDWRALPDTHWSVTAVALPWLAMALAQLWRMKLGGPLARLRLALAALSGLIAGLGLLAAAVPLNPLLTGDMIRGPLLADSLALAYLAPALLLAAAALRMPHLPLPLRQSLGTAAAALAALYAVLEIRRFWRGEDLSLSGTTQPELYSYTLALLLLGVALLWQAIARRSALLRRLAMGTIALTVAKVFLIDASGLSGLMRVFSFLALGLSLAGLAWLNRWAGMRATEGKAPPPPL